MVPFVESNDILDDPARLRKRMRHDGYLFLRNLLPKDDVLDLRRAILGCCEAQGWLRPGTDPMDGLTDREPIMEGEDEYVDVYARIQSMESFHKLKLHQNILRIMEALFQEEVFPFPQTIGRIAFPRDNARGTQPHQDWIFVGGSMETISCWVPLGDVPLEVGGLKILAESHKAGFLEPRPAPGPGGRIVEVDPELEWHQSGFRSGDVLLFKALTVHAAAANLTKDRLRLSADYRYTGSSHVVADEWFLPHFSADPELYTWEKLEKGWQDSPVAHYWDRWPKVKTRVHTWFWDPTRDS